MRSMNYLGEMNTREIEQLAKQTSLVFLPIAPMEVHSIHLPLCTDVESSMEVCERAALKLALDGIDSAIAPPVNYALADVANVFPGNISLRSETVSAVVSDICVSLAKWGFTDVAIICGHGEPANIEALENGAKEAMERQDGLNVIRPDWFWSAEYAGVLTCEHPEWDLHAGEMETGLILMRRPELVDIKVMKQLKPNWSGEHLEEATKKGYNFYEAGATQAYFGDPASGSIEIAARAYGICANYVVNDVKKRLMQS